MTLVGCDEHIHPIRIPIWEEVLYITAFSFVTFVSVMEDIQRQHGHNLHFKTQR